MGRNGRCYFCPKQRDLEDHHVIPQRFGGPDSDDNIVRVCDRCHKKLERLYDKSFYEWFGIDDEQGSTRFHRPCNHWGDNCDKMAEVKFSFHGRNQLRCREHAAVMLVREYLNNKRRRGRRMRHDSITDYWNDRVAETADGVERPEWLEAYCEDAAEKDTIPAPGMST